MVNHRRSTSRSGQIAVATVCWAATSILLGWLNVSLGQTMRDAITDLRIAKGSGLIAEAWFAAPTTRYRHFVLGSNYEPAALVVKLRDGRTLRLTLPDDSVFEDREPRLADLDGDGIDEIIVVKSYLARGSALAVIGLRNGTLEIVAETPPIGTPNRWLNPAGIVDFDGDGRLDIAYVQMPHILGLLRVVTLRGGQLVEIAQVPGVSNHRAGSRDIRLSVVLDVDSDGKPELILPDRTHRFLRVLTFNHQLVERGCLVVSTIDQAKIDGPLAIERLTDGRAQVVFKVSTGARVAIDPLRDLRQPGTCGTSR